MTENNNNNVEMVQLDDDNNNNNNSKAFSFKEKKQIKNNAKLVFLRSFRESYYDRKRRQRDVVLSIIAVLGVVFAVISEEVGWDEDSGVMEFTRNVEILQGCCSFCTLLLLFGITEYYFFLGALAARKLKVVGGVWFWNLRELRLSFMAEIFICFIHPFPGLSYINPTYYRTNIACAVLTLLMFFRFYIIARAVLHFYPFWRNRHKPVLKKINVSYNWWFIAKEIFYSHPIIFAVILWVGVCASLGYALYLAERASQPLVFGYYQNALWVVMITMTTVGYGDEYPVSNFGRSASAFSAWMGIAIASVATAVMINSMQLSSAEKTAVDTYQLHEAAAEMERIAAIILQTSFRRSLWRRKHETKSVQDKWEIESAFSRKLGFLFFKLNKQRRVLALIRAQLGENSVGERVLREVNSVSERLAFLEGMAARMYNNGDKNTKRVSPNFKRPAQGFIEMRKE